MISQMALLNDQIQEIKKDREAERTLIYEMWTILCSESNETNEFFSPPNTATEPAVLGDNSKFVANNVPNDDAKRIPLACEEGDANKPPSFRNLRAQNFHSKMQLYYDK